MTEKEISHIIDKSMEAYQGEKIVEKLKYVMDFGEVTIQYDFCLN